MIEVESEILSSVIDCRSFHRYVPKYGWRAWMAEGKTLNVVYWDSGNGWCAIIDVIPHKGKTNYEVVKFYKKLKKEISKCYDENGYRIC